MKNPFIKVTKKKKKKKKKWSTSFYIIYITMLDLLNNFDIKTILHFWKGRDSNLFIAVFGWSSFGFEIEIYSPISISHYFYSLDLLYLLKNWSYSSCLFYIGNTNTDFLGFLWSWKTWTHLAVCTKVSLAYRRYSNSFFEATSCWVRYRAHQLFYSSIRSQQFRSFSFPDCANRFSSI